MAEMNYEWFAKSSDGSVIWEYSDGEERSFQDVRDQDDTVLLGLKNRVTGKELIVDLSRGMVAVTPDEGGSTELISFELEDSTISGQETTYKPIYFKNRRADIGMTSGETIGMSTVHCLGFEGTGKLSDRKVLLKVDDNTENLITVSVE